jgi:hypothetical protein
LRETECLRMRSIWGFCGRIRKKEEKIMIPETSVKRQKTENMRKSVIASCLPDGDLV